MSEGDKKPFSNDFPFLKQLLAEIALCKEHKRGQLGNGQQKQGNKPDSSAAGARRNVSVLARHA